MGLGVSSACDMATQYLTHYLASQITTIEKQFGHVLSRHSFLGAMTLDFFLRRVHIPRSMYMMGMVYGVGALTCATVLLWV